MAVLSDRNFETVNRTCLKIWSYTEMLLQNTFSSKSSAVQRIYKLFTLHSMAYIRFVCKHLSNIISIQTVARKLLCNSGENYNERSYLRNCVTVTDMSCIADVKSNDSGLLIY